MSQSAPVEESSRIESIDVLRGFALFGILLLNILAFGLHSAAYSNPVVDGATTGINFGVWFAVDTLFEGSMRCLFSMLFGAGVVLFTTGEKARSGAIHYRRTFWLGIFGLLDIFVLLWLGDVLFAYALAGAILYLLRNFSPRSQIIASLVLVVLMSAFYLVTGSQFRESRSMGDQISSSDSSATEFSAEQLAIAALWAEMEGDFDPGTEAIDEELLQRQGGYGDNLEFTLKKSVQFFIFIIPVYLIWDALALMLLGMALFKLNVLDASRSVGFYIRMAIAGFAIGLAINLYEVITYWQSDFDILVGFPFIRPTYHLGRMGMAAGYLAVIMLCCKLSILPWLMSSLAAVGRMALTNYLSHSLICLVLFTGVGFSLLGNIDRWQLYPIVFVIWLFQLLFSPWWLKRYKFGPVEWLWRFLTYGKAPDMVRK